MSAVSLLNIIDELVQQQLQAGIAASDLMVDLAFVDGGFSAPPDKIIIKRDALGVYFVIEAVVLNTHLRIFPLDSLRSACLRHLGNLPLVVSP